MEILIVEYNYPKLNREYHQNGTKNDVLKEKLDSNTILVFIKIN